MNDADVLTHLTTGAGVVYAIETLKRWGAFRWLTVDSDRLNRLVAVLAAGLVAMGISVTGDAETGWTIHVPMLSVLLAGAWEWAKQAMVQQLLYDVVIRQKKRRRPPGEALSDVRGFPITGP